MKHNIVRTILLCMVMMCGVGNAWGQNVLETIGKNDFSTGYLGAESNSTKQTLEGDGTVHFRFVNHNNGGTDNYKNFHLVVRSVASPNNPLVALRADSWENVAWNKDGITNNYDWTNFNALMNGATVDMNIVRSGTTFSMTSTVTTTEGKIYRYNYTKNNLATGAVTVGLSVEAAYLDVYEASSNNNIIYYYNNYEDDVVKWSTGTGGRYTPVVMDDDSKYVSVNQAERNNNGATLTSNETTNKVAAGSNFTMSLRVKLGASTNQTATAFNIYDARNSSKILELAEVTTYATQWTINGNPVLKATVSAGGDKGIGDLSWVHIKVTYYDGITFLTLTDASGNIIDEYDTKVINTLTTSGGLGRMEFVTSRYYANFAIDDILVRNVIEDEDLPNGALPPEASFTYTSRTLRPGTTTYTQRLITNSKGAVTYSSDNTSVVTVDATTGEVTIVAEGKATITASLAAAGVFTTAEASYTITVSDPQRNAGDETMLADIDFSDPMYANAGTGYITGLVNKMTGMNTTGTSFEKGYNGTNADVLRVGGGQGVVNLENTKIGEYDVVTVSFDMYFGNLIDRNAGFDLLDAEGGRIGGFNRCMYNNVTRYDDFGLDWGKITAIGSGSASNNSIFTASNKTTFTITLDYLNAEMSIDVNNGTHGSHERKVQMKNTNLLSQFVIKSDYTNSDRRCWFDNLQIKVIEADPANIPVNYTVQYQTADGVEVKPSVTKRSIPNVHVELGSSDVTDFVTEDKTTKYLYVSDNTENVTIAQNGSSVITVIFREAAKYDWKLTSSTANIVTQLPSGTSFEGDVVNISYPRFAVDNNGNLYSVEALTGGNQYEVSFTPEHDDYEYLLDYIATGENNVVFLSEAEDIEGLIDTNNGGNGTRTSSGMAAYPATKTLLKKNLTRGNYVLTAYVYNNTNKGELFELSVMVGDITIWSLRTNTNGLGSSTSQQPFGIRDENTEITLPVCGTADCAFDVFYIRRVGEFAGDPVIVKNLKPSYKVEKDQTVPLTLQLENGPLVKWYEWTGKPSAYSPMTVDVNSAYVTLVDGVNTNSYRYVGTELGTKYFFAQVIGYGSSLFSNLASVETVNAVPDEGAISLIYSQDYEKISATDWSGSSDNSIGNMDGERCATVGNSKSGSRAAFIQLSNKFDDAPSLQNGTWILDYDFSPGTVGTYDVQGFSIYNAALGMPLSNTNYAPNDANVFFGLNATAANSSEYTPYLGGVAQASNITLTAGAWYHVQLTVTNTSIDVKLTDGRGGSIVYGGNTTTPLTTGMDLGGIHHFLSRGAGTTYYDNIEIKIKSNQPIIASDLPEFSEGNDDYYINDGDGLNFEVPAATEFEWYVCQMAPSKTGDGINTPRIEADGSITWIKETKDDGTVIHNDAFMTVTSPVSRQSTTITKTNGVATVTNPEVEGKHVVDVPTRGKDVTDDVWFKTPGCYADTLLKSGYTHVQTVWDEATKVTVDDNDIYRYYPEATASGSRWHYLRQLWIPTGGASGTAESDHVDYVWCVAKNALGEVTSKVAQITIYPMQPQIWLEEDYFTDDANGARADMTLPAIYKFRNYGVKIHANNLIFNTDNLKVPYATRSYIHYRDKVNSSYVNYDPNTDVMGTDTKWKNGETEWTGVISTTIFSGFDETLEHNASVHGFYKSMPMPLPVDFAYGLIQMKMQGAAYHDVAKDAERNSIAEYIIGPTSNSSLQATQDIHFDYGRYTAAEVQLQPVSAMTIWDWSKLPTRKFLTYNKAKYTSEDDIKKYIYTIPNTSPAVTYVVDPETGLGGPEMGQEYVMANFYGYGIDELEGFPSDKVAIGVEYVNNPTDKCMQGNAFTFKPTASGTLKVQYSGTGSSDDRYLELCVRDGSTETAKTAYDANYESGKYIIHQGDDAKELTMRITKDMVGDGKFVVIRARNTNDAYAADGTKNHYFRIYSATYIPDAAPVTFTEWKVKERPVGDPDEYLTLGNGEKSDGFISLATTTPNAVIKYKVLTGNEMNDAAIKEFMSTDAYKNLEVQTYKEDVYKDPKDENIKIGIHCPVNSTIFAWTEIEGMNPSEVTWHKTNAMVFPVDIRFMKDFDNSSITTQTLFDKTYWDESGAITQDLLKNYTDLSDPENIKTLKNLSTTSAPKPWKTVDSEGKPLSLGSVAIGGVNYIADNFEQFFITHGTTIDIFVNPNTQYKFDGLGAPSFDSEENKVVDLMRSGDKAKHVHYHLLYDKAKAATTAGIAFIIANFTDRTEPLTAQVKVTEESQDLYSINVDAEDKIIAPVYHTAHKDNDVTVTHWTDLYEADPEGHYEDYMPGVKKQIYENTLIKPSYRTNEVADNYRGRTRTMNATWWFTTDHNAQPLEVKEVTRDFYMPYVTPVRRHEIGTAEKNTDNDLWFDLPMTITPTTSGRLDNTIVPDWCSVGRGTTFTLPACPGATVQMEVRSKISEAATGTKFGGATPILCKVKYKGDNEYTAVPDPSQFTPTKTIESYVYTATYDGDAETLDIVLGNDYSYIRNISLTMPPVISKRDAALVTLHFSELADIMRRPYGQGHTGDGYEYDNTTPNASLFKTHYSGELCAIYYDAVSEFKVTPGDDEVPGNVPYVNGSLGYTYSNGSTTAQGQSISSDGKGTFIIGPFRSITHVRYNQGSSDLEGGRWNVSVARKPVSWTMSALNNGKDDPRRTILDFNTDVTWSAPKYATNSTSPEWVEMDIEEHIGNDKTAIDANDYDEQQGYIWIRFQADKPNVYLFGLEIYGVASTSEQQAILETNVMIAEDDDATTYEPSLVAGEIFHFPYLLRLDENYQPVSNIQDMEDNILQFNEGREVTLTANPNVGYELLKWVQEGENGDWKEVSRENPYKFNIDNSRKVRAVFVHRGIINYTTTSTHYGLVPEPVQTDKQGGFVVAENRSLFAGEGQTLRRWQDTEPKHEWYGNGKSSSFDVSTNMLGVSKQTVIEASRAATGVQIDVTPEFTDNQLNLIDIVGRIGATARWTFGKHNGAPTMEGTGTTPRLVTQVSVSGSKDVLNNDNTVSTLSLKDVIDVNLEISITTDVNNAGRADAYATVKNDGQFTLPATKGMKIEIGAKTDIEYSIDGGANYTKYKEPFRLYINDPSITLQLKNADQNENSLELDYIQATYYQRAQTPVLSMQNVDVIGDHPSNNVQVQVQTKSNPTAVRFYTLDGSDPQYVEENGTYKPANNNTRLVRGNYITINETQIGSGSTLKVLSVVSDRADSEIATLDLEKYDPDLGLATYVYDSRIIDIHQDQIFKKLMAEHKGHFNLLSYDLNPDAAVIPSVITDHTTVFVTSDAVRGHLMKALTDPSDLAAHGQKFKIEPLIVGTPLYISWKKNASTGEWQDIPWSNNHKNNSAGSVNYTEYMTTMKNSKLRDDVTLRDDANQTYADYYSKQITAAGGVYTLTFFDNMLLDGNEVCISNTMDNAPENLTHNGTQLVFNATELLTRKTDGKFADVSTFGNMLLTLMAPTTHPQLTGVKMTDTFEITDQDPDGEGYVNMTAEMLSALSDGIATMPQTYLAAQYPQFEADRDKRYYNTPGKGKVDIQNVETWRSDADGNINTVEKLGAQGVEDLATIITVTDPTFSGYSGDLDFKRTYRVEYNVPLESLTFRKEGDTWVCNETELCTLTESKDMHGQPTYKFHGPTNIGIKEVCFNGYAVAPSDYFENGEIKSDLNDDGTPMYSVWGRGEKFNDTDDYTSPTAYNVTGTFIPEYPENGEESERQGLQDGQWMTSHFRWGYRNCNQMAFTLLNIKEYVGHIKVMFYRRQAEAPQLVSTNIYDGMAVPANGEFTMEFNTIMHQVRVPGHYDIDVDWTAHIIPDELSDGTHFEDIRTDFRKVDQYDTDAIQTMLSAEGGTGTLTFHYWHLEEGKKYWLHIPFHILRSDVGESLPYTFPAEGDENEYERQMSWTNYVSEDGTMIPYFDIPFTVERTKYAHDVFDYIVDNDNWWDAYKEKTPQTGALPTATKLPNYAKWDGDFAKGIGEIKKLEGQNHSHYFMHVQKNLKGNYSLGDGDAGKIMINTGNFSIVGEGPDSTQIYANVSFVSGEGKEGLREGNNTATLHIEGDNVYLQDLTIENGQQGDDSKGQEYPAVYSHGDRHTFYNLDIKAYEESYASFGTLGYLENCKISGFGDFIVGSGDVWFENCTLLLRNKNLINLCAPSTKATEQWGFVFNGCHIDREDGASNVIDHNWTLARPWQGYDDVTKSPAATFLNTKITVLPTNTGYAYLTEDLRLRFHEYGTYKNNIENPAPLSMRSVANCMPTLDSDYPVLTKEQAAEYNIQNVFGRGNDGYDPQTLTVQAAAPVLTNDGMVLHWKADRKDLCYLVYYLGDGEKPEWDNAMMFCCVPGTDEDEAYCYLTNHDLSPIFRTGVKVEGQEFKPIAFSELWYGKRKVNGGDEAYNDDDLIDGMGKSSPSRLWFAVRAANQMGGLSEMSNALMYHAARQYRTEITREGILKGDDSGKAFSTIYLDFQARAPKGVRAYALTDVSSYAGDGSSETTLTFTRVSDSNDDNHQDVIYADQGYLIYGPINRHIFIETTAMPDNVDLESALGGSVGVFLNKVTEYGFGEKNDDDGFGGWSIYDGDYENTDRGNVSAYTLQNHSDILGFYRYNQDDFAHHRAYLDTDVAAEMLMRREGISKEAAMSRLARGFRMAIKDAGGSEMGISTVMGTGAQTDAIYDLMGVRIRRDQMVSGRIYIVNGRKVLHKK